MSINTLPKEIFTHSIFPVLPKSAILSVRLVSTTVKKWMDETITTPQIDISLDGKEVLTAVKAGFKEQLAAFLHHQMKMSLLRRHPELLSELDLARADMRSKGKEGPYTVQDFLNYSPDTPRQRQIFLPLVLFDFETKRLQVLISPHVGIPKALIDAVKTNSLELVDLVLSHPKAAHLWSYNLQAALESNPKDPKIRLRLLSHPNAAGLRIKLERTTLFTLLKMCESNNDYSFEDYATIFGQLPKKTGRKIFKLLRKELGSAINDITKNSIEHFRTNKTALIKVLNKLLYYI